MTITLTWALVGRLLTTLLVVCLAYYLVLLGSFDEIAPWWYWTILALLIGGAGYGIWS